MCCPWGGGGAVYMYIKPRIDWLISDTLFMTASSDSTLKFWVVYRAGITKKYIPNFDKADTQAQVVVAGDETALTVGRYPGCRCSRRQQYC